MEEDIPLARAKKLRQSVLLAHPRSGVSGVEPAGGDKRKKAAGNAKGNKGKAAVTNAEESKGDAKTPHRDGKGGRKRGLHYTLGRAIREAKGRNTELWRSASQLGIEWPDERCEDSRQTKAHYWKETNRVGAGTIFTCQHCLRVLWLPNDFPDAVKFSQDAGRNGYQKAYCRMLDQNPSAKRLVAKLQDIRYILQIAKPEHQALIVAAIMQDAEYPYTDAPS